MPPTPPEDESKWSGIESGKGLFATLRLRQEDLAARGKSFPLAEQVLLWGRAKGYGDRMADWSGDAVGAAVVEAQRRYYATWAATPVLEPGDLRIRLLPLVEEVALKLHGDRLKTWPVLGDLGRRHPGGKQILCVAKCGDAALLQWSIDECLRLLGRPESTP